jgi:ATP-dependent DNA helicase PIF1
MELDVPPPYSEVDISLLSFPSVALQQEQEHEQEQQRTRKPLVKIAHLNQEQELVVKQVQKGQDVLITGPAGTGKSFLIDHLCKEFAAAGKVYRILAPTGVAALNIGGQTIHRFLGLRPEIKTIEDYIKFSMKRTKVPWGQLDVLVIDEVSMIHPKLFSLFDTIARLHKRNTIPFGGIQMVMIGDFFQLCPIREKTDRAGDPEYIFHTVLWKQLTPKIHVLKKVMRQNDLSFIAALNDLRVGLYSETVHKMITTCRKNKRVPGKHYVRLFSLNVDKNFANETELAKLATEKHIFKASDVGDEKYLIGCRADKEITLKKNCPVMLLWNIPEENLCNGSVGILEDFEKETGLPIVAFNNGVVATVTKKTWSITEKGRHGAIKTLAARTQIPLCVAFSISAHKSQGITLEYVEADCKGIFTTGQLYVMLSRASTPDGLIIKNFHKDAIMVDEQVVEFYNLQITKD